MGFATAESLRISTQCFPVKKSSSVLVVKIVLNQIKRYETWYFTRE